MRLPSSFLTFGSNLFKDFSTYKIATTMNDHKKHFRKKYLAPTAEVVQVDVERGFAVSAPGYGDGGPW